MTYFKKIFLFVVIFILSFFYLYKKYESKLTDIAFFGGDEWEYQSIGVNLAYGHGYQEGKLEDFSTYKFNTSENYSIYHDPLTGKHLSYKDYFFQGGVYSFYRTPGYPVFLAIIYRFFGVHPLYVKIIQIILISICSALLPFLAEIFWGSLGLFSGIFASFFFIQFFTPNPTEIMTETLITFTLFIWVLIFLFWKKRKNFLRTFLLGFFSAVIILVKGLNFFVPFIFLLILIFYPEISWQQKFKLIIVFIFGMTILIMPWSFYATSKIKRPVFISIHQDTLLLDSNNENAIYNGDWHPQWRKDFKNEKNYFYYSLKDSGYSPLKKVMIFFWKHKKLVPVLLFNKFRRLLFCSKKVFVVLFFMFLFYLSRFLLRKPFFEPATLISLIFAGNIFLITLIFYGRYLFILPFLPFFLLNAVYFPFFVVKEIILKIKAKRLQDKF